MAITCYKCPLLDANTTYMSLFQQGQVEGVCSSPTYSVNCSKDSDFGDLSDACHTATIRLNVSYKHIGLVKFNKLSCGVKFFCDAQTKQLCNTLKGYPYWTVLECVGSCCEEDFCNQPMNPSSNYVPPNTAMLGILGITAVVLANLNVD